ncbi:putative D-aminoacylase [Hypoxylon sp. NC1633]|nr:putative D-aminoacylase [Hypoxylon sp. NC1633]
MPSFDDFLVEVTTSGDGRERRLPGCVLVAYKDGATHHKSFGTKSIDPNSPRFDEPLSIDSCMWVASCTKLMTAIAVLQCVERGLLSLDDDISTVVPEWKEREILLGFDETTGAPLLEKAEGKISLRMLLTHCSGLGYAFMEPDFARYIKYKILHGWVIESELLCPADPVPLLYKPGTDWKYGIGTDWAGKLVERATGLSLGDFMDKNIWKPLGMTSTSFRILERPDISARQADLSVRVADGVLSPHAKPFFPVDMPTDHGGAGVYSCPRDFIKVLATCAASDPKLLSPASYDLLCEPSLPAESAAKFQATRSATYAMADAAAEKAGTPMAIPAPSRMSWAPGGMLATEDVPGGRRAGSISWGGMPNLSWVVDRVSGVALFYASQLLPPGDALTSRIVRRLEAEVYSGEFFDGAQLM